MISGSACPQNRRLVIKIIGGLGVAAGDENVLVAVVVEVAKQRTPAPVRVSKARQVGDLAEDHIPVLRDAVAQLQRVRIVVVAKSPPPQVDATVIGEVPAHPLL